MSDAGLIDSELNSELKDISQITQILLALAVMYLLANTIKNSYRFVLDKLRRPDNGVTLGRIQESQPTPGSQQLATQNPRHSTLGFCYGSSTAATTYAPARTEPCRSPDVVIMPR